MTTRIVECIPNFSEARRPEVVAEIAAQIESVKDVRILDQHSDMDHNRTVITFVGSPEGVEEAAYLSIARAAVLINLDDHKGEHPRIGATDVVPFVPISGASMSDCVEMARRLGKRVSEDLGIPVYLYEAAATQPERVNLENIRRGQYEGLKQEIGVNPARMPDFGPAKLTPAGATVIGARHPLIAYNVYLTTDDVSVASKIARTIRHSSGGLRYVKAMGILVDGRAQVSMNLTNFKLTSIASVVEMIRREAARYGVQIHHSELVGLVPNQAMVDAAVWYTQMGQFEPGQILETRLYEQAFSETAAEAKKPMPNFLDELASSDPTPGGGSAAAFSAAMAASLVAMVGRVTIGKKKYADVETEMWEMVEKATDLQEKMKQAVIDDAKSFEAYIEARRLPVDTEAQKESRIKAIQAASIHAAEVPLQVVRNTLEILVLAVQSAELGNVNAISDAAAAAALAKAGIEGAGLNVRINLLGLEKESVPAQMLGELRMVEKQVEKYHQSLYETLVARGGMHFS